MIDGNFPAILKDTSNWTRKRQKFNNNNIENMSEMRPNGLHGLVESYFPKLNSRRAKYFSHLILHIEGLEYISKYARLRVYF